MLSRQSIVSSTRTVRPCAPRRGWWIGHWKTTLSKFIFSSPPHSHAAEGVIPVCVSRSVAEGVKSVPSSFWKGHSGKVGADVGDESAEFVVLSNHFAFHPWSAQSAAFLLSLSDELMSCAVGTNGCLDLRRRAFAPGERESAERSKCSSYMARLATLVIACLHRDDVHQVGCLWGSIGCPLV